MSTSRSVEEKAAEIPLTLFDSQTQKVFKRKRFFGKVMKL